MRTVDALAGIVFLAAATPLAEWRRIEPGLSIELPKDHGSHPGFRTEWWYVTGHLADEAGREFGFQFTIFRNGLDPEPAAPGASPLRARQVFAGHLAVTDVASGRTLFAERLRRAAAGLAGADEDRLSAFVENWSIEGTSDERQAFRVVAADPAAGISLALALEPRKEAVLHGDGGYSRKGDEDGNASAYVSFTRLEATGTLSVPGSAPRAVRGEAWFDHEWGTTQLGAGIVGWDWFSLQLGDGRELMLYVLRREDGSPAAVSAGTLVRADGSTRRLAREDFAIERTAEWTSPRSRASYPAGWRVRVPSESLEFDVAPAVPDCEIDSKGSTGVVYWEGPVRVTGGAGGRGYAELTGYAGSLGGRF